MEGSHSAYYTFEEAMEKLDIDRSRLIRLVTEGEIRGFREGGSMRFKKVEIDRLAERPRDDDPVAFP